MSKIDNLAVKIGCVRIGDSQNYSDPFETQFPYLLETRYGCIFHCCTSFEKMPTVFSGCRAPVEQPPTRVSPAAIRFLTVRLHSIPSCSFRY
jgi:hypothetical protein